MGTNRRGHNSSGSGKSNKSRGIGGNTKKNRGPKHGHSNKSKGGGTNAWSGNPTGMTFSEAMKIYGVDNKTDLQSRMSYNPAETTGFYNLIDDSQKTNTNNMTLTDKQSRLNQIYVDELGRDVGWGETGGGQYWLDTHAQGDNVDWDNIRRMVAGSDEGQKHRGEVEGYNQGQVYVGGIDSTKSIASQSREGFWGDHFKEGGVFEHQNAAAKAQAIADKIGFTPAEAYFNNSVGGGGGDDNDTVVGGDGNDTVVGGDGNDTVTTLPVEGWWNQFEDADAFKAFLQGDQTQSSTGGMDDFMKFMMLMSVMGGGRGGGMGGGSQYGYGGLNPGGVQAAYNPLENLQGMGDWFNNNFGSNSGASTATVNTT